MDKGDLKSLYCSECLSDLHISIEHDTPIDFISVEDCIYTCHNCGYSTNGVELTEYEVMIINRERKINDIIYENQI